MNWSLIYIYMKIISSGGFIDYPPGCRPHGKLKYPDGLHYHFVNIFSNEISLMGIMYLTYIQAYVFISMLNWMAKQVPKEANHTLAKQSVSINSSNSFWSSQKPYYSHLLHSLSDNSTMHVNFDAYLRKLIWFLSK